MSDFVQRSNIGQDVDFGGMSPDGTGQGGVPHTLQEHIPGLDGLRGLAAWLVVLSHLSFFGLAGPIYPQIGNYGVFLFFVLSGFLMGHLYIAKSLSRGRVFTYFAARISRIVPLYFSVLLAGFLYGRFVDPEFRYAMSLLDLARHLLFVGNVSVFWSIGPEFQFYFLFPLLWLVASLPSEKRANWLIPLTAVAMVIILFRSAWPGILVVSKLHIFLTGVLIGVLRPKVVKAISPGAAVAAQIISVGFILVLFLPADVVGSTIYPSTANDLKHNLYYQDFGKLFPLAFVIFAFSIPTKFAERVFANKLAVLSGRYSFSIYLLHVPVLYVFEKTRLFTVLPFAASLVAVATAILAVTAASFYFLEEPSRVATRKLLLRTFERFGGNRTPAAQLATNE